MPIEQEEARRSKKQEGEEARSKKQEGGEEARSGEPRDPLPFLAKPAITASASSISTLSNPQTLITFVTIVTIVAVAPRFQSAPNPSELEEKQTLGTGSTKRSNIFNTQQLILPEPPRTITLIPEPP
jgi:hypothetical protein